MPAPTESRFTQGNVMRHVTVMSLTSSVGIMAIYVVDLLDIFFISLLGQAEMAAAAGYASTLLFFVSAINIGLSVATGTLVAQMLGSGHKQGARDVAAAAVMIAAGLGVIIPLLIYPFLPVLVRLLGAEDAVADMAVGYLRIVLPATILSGISMSLVASLRAQGEAKRAMYPALAGALVNLIFDPLLIFGLGLDLPGAAMATVLARAATLAVALRFVLRNDAIARPDIARARRHAGAIMGYAGPSVAASVAAPIGLAIITRAMSHFGTDAVTAVALIGRLSPVVFSVVNALSGAIGPIIGQNHGAGRADRVRRAYFDAMIFLALYVALAMSVLYLTRGLIADAFGAEGLTRDILFFYFGPLAMLPFLNGAIFVASATFTNLGFPHYASAVSWARSTAGLAACVWIGVTFFGVWGVGIGVLVNAAVFAAIGHALALYTMTHAKPLSREDDDSFDYADEEEHRNLHHAEPLHT